MLKLNAEYRAKRFPDTPSFRMRGPSRCTYGIVRHCPSQGSPTLIYVGTDSSQAILKQHRFAAMNRLPDVRLEIVEIEDIRTNPFPKKEIIPIQLPPVPAPAPIKQKTALPLTDYVLAMGLPGTYVRGWTKRGWGIVTGNITRAKRYQNESTAIKKKERLEKTSGIPLTVQAVPARENIHAKNK